MNNPTDPRIEESYLRLHPRLWRSLLAFTADPDLASDAEAEGYSQALRRGSEINNIDAWIWRSCFRIAAGLLSEKRSTVQPPTHAVDPPDDSHALSQPTIEFMSQLTTLSDQQRSIVVLRYLGDFYPREIADLLETSSGTVRVQLHRAHKALRTMTEEMT